MPATRSSAEPSNAQIAELLPSLQVLSKELEQEIKSGKLQISMGPRGLTISFAQAALFPSGEDVIAPDTYPSVKKIATAITEIPNPVRMEGHTDAVPIHNSRFRSNWELSAARSIALLELLTSFGVSKDRLSIAGYADTAPVDDNQTVEGRQKNRRVDIVILDQTGVKGEPERPPLARRAGKSPPRSAETLDAEAVYFSFNWRSTSCAALWLALFFDSPSARLAHSRPTRASTRNVLACSGPRSSTME